MTPTACRGCSVVTLCYILSQNMEYFYLNCPCQKCLVNVMCSHTCIEYEDFTDVLVMVQKELENEGLKM